MPKKCLVHDLELEQVTYDKRLVCEMISYKQFVVIKPTKRKLYSTGC